MKTREDRILEWVKGPAVLDIGCTDHVVRENSVYWLHQHMWQSFALVVGIDISEENLEKMRQLGYQDLFRMKAETFSLNETFDTIVAGELAEHLSNPGLFFDRARQHLGRGGRMILTTPFAFSLLNVLYANLKFPKTCENPEHTLAVCGDDEKPCGAAWLPRTVLRSGYGLSARQPFLEISILCPRCPITVADYPQAIEEQCNVVCS